MAYLENVTLRITTIVATFWVTLGKIATFYSFINGPFTASFSLFLCFQYSLFAQLKVNKIANNWIRFELRISSIGSERSTNCATTSAQTHFLF